MIQYVRPLSTERIRPFGLLASSKETIHPSELISLAAVKKEFSTGYFKHHCVIISRIVLKLLYQHMSGYQPL